MATTTILNDLIDLNQTGNTTALKGCVGTNAQQPATPTISVQYLVVGGGGGGGSNGTASGDGLGGGGAGGFSTGTIAVPNNTAVNIVVGEGGLGGGQTSDQSGTNGQDSGFYTIQGQGGGGGGEGTQAGFPGGSGGGGGRNSGNLTNTGTGVSGQGNNGGLGGYTGGSYQASSGGGGGGASTVGATGGNSQSSAGAGGTGSDAVALGIITQANGITASIGEVDGATLNFSGGGGGGQASAGAANDGGLGGGGNGGTNSVGSVGTANTGGGGGGDGSTTQGGGGTGGSGVVILKYANTATETIAGLLAGGITTGTTGTCDYPITATALYQFENNVNDTCGTYNGTANAITYTTGKFGQAAVFNGSSSFIDLNLKNQFKGTVSIWFNGGTPSAQCFLYASTAGSSGNKGIALLPQTNGTIRVVISQGTSGTNALDMSTTDTFFDSNWYNAVLTWDLSISGTNVYLYVNNVVKASGSATTGNWTTGQDSTSNLILGHYNNSGGSETFNGNIDQVRIFSSVLTADQVSMLYAESVGATKFTESSDTVLVFKAGSGTINLTDTSLPGPKVGDLRTNTDQSSASSASAMEHYMSTGWRVFNNFTTLSVCNYPTTATALYQFEDTPDATCGPNPTTTANLTYVTGKFGKAVDFNGTNSVWNSTSSIVDVQQDFSISVWFNLDSYDASNNSYLSTFFATGDAQLYINTSNNIKFNIYNNSSSPHSEDVVSTTTVSLNTWYHVVFTRSTTNGMELYINATSEDTNSSTKTPQYHGGPTPKDSIGCYGDTQWGDRAYFDGQIDQFRAFQSVLTAAQVTELYNE